MTCELWQIGSLAVSTAFVLLAWWCVWQSTAQLSLLRALMRGGEWYGLDLVHDARVGRGVVYVHLEALERRGLVESRQDGAGRRLYRIAPLGTLRGSV